MTYTWSDIQYRRLIELNAADEVQQLRFEDTGERDRQFQQWEKRLIKNARRQLLHFREQIKRPALCRLQESLCESLTAAGFVQVVTPTIMSRGLLARMGIDDQHPLNAQVFWLDRDRCLRPMLAPHLYYLLKDLLRIWEKPVKLFEVGSCFRKESQGAQHAEEFTMLNLVEMGLPEAQCRQRLDQLALLVTQAAGITSFQWESETSAVYGETMDLIAGKENMEIGSAAMGPHPLDQNWRIMEAWAGIGLGLERLLMVREESSNLSRMGRSLAYLNGIRLNI